MITWGAVISKLVEHLAKSLINRTLRLKTNEKKRAARTLTRLSLNLQKLSELTERTIYEIDLDNRDTCRVEGAWLSELKEDLELISNEFISTAKELELTLELFDKELRISLSKLMYGKFSFLVIATHGLEIIASQEPFQIEYSYPDKKILEIDYSKHYEWLKENSESQTIIKYEWPQDILFGANGDLISTDALPKKGSPEYQNKLEKFIKILKQHNSQIKESNSLLTKLIQKEFSLADILYSDHP
ncbi:hypothetical protein [Pseudomonas nitroreducens]|uniref:hypothetical protein n=1 Tax=Pseudomonas nitroreducens TaxID=46680 RepID=UPI001FB77FA8|nr:hypothetical protein [Pseudomonas nitroreducens]MCJ1881874.1 hypothetical protein [Pseudomonas nitroreducens]MCJ1898284.1 hypothetical protein [Pseudomonas nitroreducens]